MTKEGTARMVEDVRAAVHVIHEQKLADPQGSHVMEQVLLAKRGKYYERFVQAVEESTEVLQLNEAEEATMLRLYQDLLKEEITEEGLQKVIDFIHRYRLTEESAQESSTVH